MASTWQTVRVFISSTFSDMHSERDHLVKVVFPSLREKLEKYRIHLVDIDLRWGVTREQADNDHALDLCLQQIDDCRPFFIGILGERYGWVPEKIPQSEKPEYGWVQGMTGRSITDLEIVHGVLTDHEMQSRSFFYFRDRSFLDGVPAARRRDMLSDSEESAQKLVSLKQQIRAAGVPVCEDYPCRFRGLKINWRLAEQKLKENDRQRLRQVAENGIVGADEYANLDDDLRQFIDAASVVHLDGLKTFGQAVHDQLWEAIQAQLNLPDTPPTETLAESDPLAEEADYHDRFMESRLRVYVGREPIQRALVKFADSAHTVPCLVIGPSGLGKSAALARFVTGYEQSHPDVLVIPHFIGASPASTGLRTMLQRFCEILKREFAFEEEIPPDTVSLSSLFRQFITQIPDDRRVLFVLDALNQLDETDNAHALNWLPWKPPAHVRIVVSCIDDPDRDEAVLQAFRHRKRGEYRIKPLTDEERFEIVHQVPSLSAKTLDPEQVGLLLANPATTNPLFLLVALEELRGFGSFEELNDQIRAFPREGEPITALFRQVIERLETEFGNGLVRSVFTLLASARRGLSESELQALIGADEQSENLFPVLCQARPYLQPRGNLIDFFHRGLFKAVREMYLSTDEQQVAAHRRLAAYFHRQLNPPDADPWSGDDSRALAELPYHLTQGKSWEDLEATLCDLRFVQAKCTARMTFDLVRDYSVALDALPELGEERKKKLRREERLRRYGTELIAYAQAKGEGVPLPTAPDSRESHESMRRAEATSSGCAGADISSQSDVVTIAARIRRLANFVSAHIHALSRFPDQTLTIAYNHAAGGQVVEQAGDLLDSVATTWLRRDPRPPAAPENPVCLRTLEGQPSRVRAVALSADGYTAVSAHLNNNLAVWNVATGELRSTLNGHTGWVNAVALTPDGTTAVSGSADNTMRVWDITGGMLLRTLRGHGDQVNSVALTPDGTVAVSASRDKTLRVWDVSGGKLLRILKGHRTRVTAVALTADGKTAVSASGDAAPHKVWDVDKGELLWTLKGYTGSSNAVALTPDGKTAVSGGADATLHVWDVASGELLRTLKGHADTLQGPANQVYGVTLTPDGATAVSSGGDQTLRVWDVAGGELLRTLDEGHTDEARALALTADGNTAVSASSDSTLRVWDIATGEPFRTLSGHAYRINVVALTLDGTTAVSASDDNTLCVWNVLSGKLLRTLEGHTHSVRDVAITQDGAIAIAACLDNTLRVWNISTGKLLRQLEGHSDSSWRVVLTMDGNTAVSASIDSTLRVWDIATGECLRTLEGHTDAVFFAALTPDGNTVVSGSRDGTLRVWDVASGELHRTLERHTGALNTMALTPDGKTAVSGGADATLHVWDVASGVSRCTLHGHAHVSAAVFTPDGNTVVSAGDTLRVWEGTSGDLLRTLEGHTGSVGDIALTPDGKRIASYSGKTFRVWNLNSGRVVADYQLESRATSITAVSDYRFIVGTAGGQLHFLTLLNWPAP